MSQESASTFIDKVYKDETLRNKAQALGEDMAGIVDLAKQEGFDFSKDEFLSTIRERGLQSQVELSDADLEKVAGGTAVNSTDDTCGKPDWEC